MSPPQAVAVLFRHYGGASAALHLPAGRGTSLLQAPPQICSADSVCSLCVVCLPSPLSPFPLPLSVQLRPCYGPAGLAGTSTSSGILWIPSRYSAASVSSVWYCRPASVPLVPELKLPLCANLSHCSPALSDGGLGHTPQRTPPLACYKFAWNYLFSPRCVDLRDLGLVVEGRIT